MKNFSLFGDVLEVAQVARSFFKIEKRGRLTTVTQNFFKRLKLCRRVRFFGFWFQKSCSQNTKMCLTPFNLRKTPFYSVVLAIFRQKFINIEWKTDIFNISLKVWFTDSMLYSNKAFFSIKSLGVKLLQKKFV